jgi:Mannosyl-glycoprotein endo-beta-N-acetylglucosaminidase/LysM domain
MKKHKLLFTLTTVFIFADNFIFGQSSATVLKYVDTYKNIAITEEIRTGVPASITLAQGIHETGAGTSDLVLKSNNHFGIKCKADWNGASVSHDDDAKGECFRKYDDPLDSYKDHSDFLKNRPYYSSLFNLDPMDYKAWAHGLKKAGYATNPKYAHILIKLIEDYDLQQYTLIALSGKYDNGDAVFASKGNNETSTQSNTTQNVIQKAVAKTYNYPTEVFKINETKVVFVKKGTAFLKVANDNDISLPRLFEFNDMKSTDIAETDQLIYLQRKRKLGSGEYHVVQEGETVYDIAQIEGIRLESLLEYNLLKTGMQPEVGETLNLKWKVSQMPKLLATR